MDQICTSQITSSGFIAGPSGIRAGWVIEINGRFEAKRPPALAGFGFVKLLASLDPYCT